MITPHYLELQPNLELPGLQHIDIDTTEIDLRLPGAHGWSVIDQVTGDTELPSIVDGIRGETEQLRLPGTDSTVTAMKLQKSRGDNLTDPRLKRKEVERRIGTLTEQLKRMPSGSERKRLSSRIDALRTALGKLKRGEYVET